MSDNHHERRRFDRIASDKPVAISTDQARFNAKVVDVSLHGLLFECDKACGLTPGTPLRACLQLGDETQCITLQGRVVRAGDGRFGMQCETLDIDSAARLRRLVELNLGDDRLLERNLEQMLCA